MRHLAIAAALFCCLGLCVSAQQASERPDTSSTEQSVTVTPAPTQNPPKKKASKTKPPKSNRTFTSDDGLAVISSALDPKVRRYAGNDCSHLVHAIYEHAGFPYNYATSDDLYDGVEGFQRVSYPQTGDVIVWPGHAGIVVRPSRHVFFSFLSGGPGISDYRNAYWIGRGEPRFYRYLKNASCPGCTPAHASYDRPRSN